MSSERIESDTLIDDKKLAAVTFYVRPAKNGILSRIGFDSEQNVPMSEIYTFHEEKNIDLKSLFLTLIAMFDPPKQLTERRLGIAHLQLEDFFSGKIEDFGRKKFPDRRTQAFTMEDLDGQLALYIITKVVKIVNKYEDFEKYTEPYNDSQNRLRFRWISEPKKLLSKLLNDQSHVTLKLKQAINAFIYQPLKNGIWKIYQDEEYTDYTAYQTTLSFTHLRDDSRLNYQAAVYKRKSLAHFIPVAFFGPSIEVSQNDKPFPFSQMSSGEQQLIHSVHSVLYHLLNIDSITRPLDNKNVKRPKYSYTHVNLILDEIELYYHPSYQKDFIQFLLDSIASVELNGVTDINILFSTHSPFILSDIPQANVMKLVAGLPAGYGHGEQTFGANIHDMLADTFFLEKSLMGAFAENTINKCIAFLEQMRFYRAISEINAKPEQTETDRTEIILLEKQIEILSFRSPLRTYKDMQASEIASNYLKGIIDLIGEPVVRFKLLEMYDEVMLDKNSEKERAKRRILTLMKENNLDREDLNDVIY